MKKLILGNKLKNALLQQNLTEKEIISYIVLLENGSMSIQEISRFSGINRVTTYAAVDDLKRKGLVAETRKGKRKLFLAENPESLTNLLQEEKERLVKREKMLTTTILPMLKAIDIKQPDKPEIKFFEGADGITKVFDEYILKSPEAINCGSYDTAIKVTSFEAEKKYFQEIRKRNMFFRFILEDTPLNHELAQMGQGITHVKFLPAEIKISADTVVFGTRTALISYDRKAVTLIEDKSIAAAIKLYLDFMWERL